ncbi:hypothetical protein CL655_03515 [bacterium]|nr:hypothetical protein [bacterium]|tara:strand:+ start:450 stop:1499 length:1050 start_codon:yes stop_codon:yes gene_type:complete
MFIRSTIFVLLLLLAQTVFAQNAGLSLTPSIIEEPAEPGEALTSAVEVENLSPNAETYYLFARDIEGVAENGRPMYVSDGFVPTDYNLSQWIALSRTEVELQPGERVSVPFIINVPEDAAPGGHFAGIFGSLEAPDANVEGVGAGVGYRVGNIINIRVAGDITEEAQIRTFQTDKLIYGEKDVTFTARVENLGNVLVRPTGPLKITNMLGDTVAEIVMNDSRSGVFPQSIRPVTAEWQENGLGFGRYVAEVAMVYGVPGEAQYTMSANTTFWVLPWEIIRPLMIVLGVLALVSYVLVRYYINQQVRKLSGGRRLVRTTGQAGPSPLVLAAIVMLFMTAFVIFLLLMIFA